MKKVTCKNCNTLFDENLEFCPACGLHQDAFKNEDKNKSKPIDYNKVNQPEPLESVVREIAKNISVIKSIMLFFTVLWILGIIVLIIN
ncbi:MAG: hypothetical protein IMY73_02825 [Bacteroidetes bacterium]|nr:hypothetical protein [Bacteroidota bacterium]